MRSRKLEGDDNAYQNKVGFWGPLNYKWWSYDMRNYTIVVWVKIILKKCYPAVYPINSSLLDIKLVEEYFWGEEQEHYVEIRGHGLLYPEHPLLLQRNQSVNRQWLLGIRPKKASPIKPVSVVVCLERCSVRIVRAGFQKL